MLAQQSIEAQHLQGTAALCPIHSSPRGPLAGLIPPATSKKPGQKHNWGQQLSADGARSGWRGHGGAEGQIFNLQLLPSEPLSQQPGV